MQVIKYVTQFGISLFFPDLLFCDLLQLLLVLIMSHFLSSVFNEPMFDLWIQSNSHFDLSLAD